MKSSDQEESVPSREWTISEWPLLSLITSSCHRRYPLSSKMYGVCLNIRLDMKTMKKRQTSLPLEMSIRSLLLLGCWCPDVCAALKSPVSHTQVHGLGFLTDCFHQVSIILCVSHSNRLWTRLFLITVTRQRLQYEPCEKTSFLTNQSRDTGTDRLVSSF